MRGSGLILATLLLLGAAVAGCSESKAKVSACGEKGSPASATRSSPVPRLTGRVVDMANILSPEAEAAITEQSAALERKTRDQLVLVTTADLRGQPIETYGLTLGNAWGIGDKKLDNGVLLIVAPKDHRVRIEVGCGLEGLLTDERAAQIIDEALISSLRRADYDAAARAGVTEIIRLLESDTRRPQRRADGKQV